MKSANDVAGIIVVLLAPVGLIYSWHFYLTQMRREPIGWRNRVTLLALALLLLGCSHQAPTHMPPNAAARTQIQRIVDSLPQDSSVRRSLEAGQFGDGIHRPWMDEMKAAGVHEVTFEVQGVWRTGFGFQPRSVQRSVYRLGYNIPESQLIDPDRIARIRASGLQARLEEAALSKARYARWPFEPHFSLLGVNSFVDVYLFDDEWVTDIWRFTDTPIITPGESSESPLSYAALVGDLLTTQQLLKSRTFTKKDLNNALIGAVDCPVDNPDVLRVLLAAGADINTSYDDGTTILMRSASPLKFDNIKLLVASGADRSKRNRAGDTAFSLVQNQILQAQKAGSPLPSYVQEIADLLK